MSKVFRPLFKLLVSSFTPLRNVLGRYPVKEMSGPNPFPK